MPTRNFQRGDPVVYKPTHGALEYGIFKRFSADSKTAFVLYHTRSQRYTIDDLDNYTAQATNIDDLLPNGD